MIYLLRHGQTVWNVERRLQGQLDSPLTPLGLDQASALGRLLKGEISDPRQFRLVASPQGRAWQTAVVVADELGLPFAKIDHEPRLVEKTYGLWQGRTLKEVATQDGERWEAYLSDRWHVRPPEGESYDDVSKRVGGWLDGIAETDRVIAVCHGVVSRVLRGRYGGLDRKVTLKLPEPQNRVFRLSGGKIETLRPSATE